MITWQQAASLAGKHFGAQGGLKSAANMTPEQRSARAKHAVAARKWRAVKNTPPDAMGEVKSETSSTIV